jgi:replicative DNA helicase
MPDNIILSDSEIAVLSIIFRNPSESLDWNGLKSFMFSSTAHEALFREIENSVENDRIPDIGLIIQSLEASRSLDKVGGREYLDFIYKQEFIKDNFHEYVKNIINSYKTRYLISIASRIKPETVTINNIDETIQEVRKTLDNLTETSGGSTTVHIGENLTQSYEEIMARTKKPGSRGISWGIPDVDRLFGGKEGGDLWYISGRPGQGKTALICNSILSDALNGIPVLFFEREMVYQNLVERLVSIYTGIPLSNIRNGLLEQKQINIIFEAFGKFKTIPVYIDTSFKATDLYYLESTINKYKKLYDIKNVYLDYVQLFSERDENQTQELGRISRVLKMMSNNADVCCVAISQLNRSVENRENKRPLLSDLRQSGNLEEDADFVVGLYRDEYYNKETPHKGLMEFIVLKNRNGPVGITTLKFEAETNKIGEA